MHTYTVTLYDQEEPRVETTWTSFPAARSFAEQLYKRRSIVCITIWNGFNPETGNRPQIKEHPDLLYFQEKPEMTITE